MIKFQKEQECMGDTFVTTSTAFVAYGGSFTPRLDIAQPIAAYFEVVILKSAPGAEWEFRLFDRTANAAITGSTILHTGDGKTRLRSGDILANLPVNSNILTSQMHRTTGVGNCTVYRSKLILVYSSTSGIPDNITQVNFCEAATNGTTTYAKPTNRAWFKYHADDWDGTQTIKLGAHISTSSVAFTMSLQLIDSSGTAVTNGTITGTVLTNYVESAALTLVDGETYELQFKKDTSPIGSAILTNAWIIIEQTGTKKRTTCYLPVRATTEGVTSATFVSFNDLYVFEGGNFEAGYIHKVWAGTLQTSAAGGTSDYQLWDEDSSAQLALLSYTDPGATAQPIYMEDDNIDTIMTGTINVTSRGQNSLAGSVVGNDCWIKMILHDTETKDAINLDDFVTTRGSRFHTDHMLLVDSSIKMVSSRRTISNVINLDDTVVARTTNRRTIANSINLIELVIRNAAFRKIVPNSVNLDDTVLNRAQYRRSVENSIVLSDLILAQKISVRTKNDSIQLVEAVTRLSSILRRVDNFVVLQDQALKDARYTRIPKDLIDLDDEILYLRKVARLNSDSISLIDAITRLLSRIITDSLSLDDFVLDSATYRREVRNSISLSDDTKRLAYYLRAIDNLVSLADSVIRMVIYRRVVSNIISLDDLVSSFETSSRSLTNFISLVDSPRKQVIYRRAVSDLINLSDFVTSAIGKSTIKADSIVLDDDVLFELISAGASFSRLDAIALSDFLTRSLVFVRAVGDLLDLRESVSYVHTTTNFLDELMISIKDKSRKMKAWNRSRTYDIVLLS